MKAVVLVEDRRVTRRGRTNWCCAYTIDACMRDQQEEVSSENSRILSWRKRKTDATQRRRHE